MIVNDGCPLEETHELGLLLSSAYENVHYERRENGGPGAARNFGVQRLLEEHPGIEAVLFLDADDYAEPHLLERLTNTLAEQDSDWSYSDLSVCGTRIGEWEFTQSVNVYRQHFENQCAVGSLVDRRVFEAGIWFDEDLTGYEDWEFFLRASLAGFRGVNAGSAGLHYRQRPHSRNYESQARHEDLHIEIRSRHLEGRHERSLLMLEHESLPRYAVIDLDTESVSQFTIPHEGPTRSGSLAELRVTLSSSNYGWRRKAPLVPPILIFTTSGVVPLLGRLKLLPGVLLRIQEGLRHSPAVRLVLSGATPPETLRVGHDPQNAGDAVALAVATPAIAEHGGLEHLQPLTTLTLAGAPVEADRLPHLDLESLAQEMRLPAPSSTTAEADGAASHTVFSYSIHVGRLDTSFPAVPRKPAVALVLVPWLGLGGYDLCVVRLAAAVASAATSVELHLVVTDSAAITTDPSNLDTFETVTVLGDLPRPDAATLLAGMTRSADVVVNAYSLLGFDNLTEFRALSNAMHVSYLQAIDFDRFGLPDGYPIRAARQHERQLDLMIVPSQDLRRLLLNLGVPDTKICVAPNAPAFTPGGLDAALALAETKARRTRGRDASLRILFAGRFDRQKGISRLARAARRLSARGVPYEMTILGAPLLDAETGEFPRECKFAPPVFSSTAVAGFYEAADVVLLPSRWEGLPLTLLDAMAFGCVAVTTDVNGIPEVLEDGVNGISISNALPDDAIGDLTADAVEELLASDSGAMREAAVRRAHELSWHDSARRILEHPVFEPLGAER